MLVGYSDSESSGDEAAESTQKPINTSEPVSTTKPSFRKRKDNAEPHKIRITLPEPLPEDDASQESSEPAQKKIRTSAGGFNAMLPAPKRQKSVLASSARGRGLGSGISLKTGAAPAFSREAPEMKSFQSQEEEIHNVSEDQGMNGISTPSEDTATAEPPKKPGSAMVFKPLSVSRKPKKKTPVVSAPKQPILLANGSNPSNKPKVSLFSTPVLDDDTPRAIVGHYEPVIYSESDQMREEDAIPDELYHTSEGSVPNQQSINQPTPSLSSIADSLNLSASQRRQLMGRKGAGLADAKVMEFNTETEYAANEELRARGETVTFNAVRSVASGKHSLQQLVNLVSNQKEALEESFAAGKRNKKEAGAKYGW